MKNHGKTCDCSECIKLEDEYLIDLSDSIDRKNLFCLNERVSDSGKTIFKRQEDIQDRTRFVLSNEDDQELLFYIPFTSMVNIKSMTMIGGEDGSSPLHCKIYVNNDNPGFSLLETDSCSQEFECQENPEGSLSYELKPSKFKSVLSLTIIITRCIDGDHSKIYHLGFIGIRTKKKHTIMNGVYELKPLVDERKIQDSLPNNDMIYG